MHNLANWLNQSLPLYWLLVFIVLGASALLMLNRRNNKRLSALETQQHELEINKATAAQQIAELTARNSNLSEKTDLDALQNTQLTARNAALQNSRDEKMQQLEAKENERGALRVMVDASHLKISELEAKAREQAAILAAEHDKIAALKTQFAEQKGLLKNEFKVVSEEIMKARQETLTAKNNEGVSALLKPLQVQITGFQQRVNEVHDAALKGNSSLKTEIENVMKMGIAMRDEASSLASALKGNSQQRGAWGEAQLERTLEMSGLIEHAHYQKQGAFTDPDGRRKQPDYLIKLPRNKCIIIDSKVSLNAYSRACAAADMADEAAQSRAMQAHIAAVKSHITNLASKQYSNLNGIDSPDFVLMFMPVEPAYIEAMKDDPTLFGFGYAQNIILVSHTTLIPILRTVANLWTLDRSNKEARQMGEKAGDIFASVVRVSERLGKLGKTLNTASGHFNGAVTSLSGMQSKVEHFKTLSNKAKQAMPPAEPMEIHFATAKLSALALPDSEEAGDALDDDKL